MFFRRPSHKGTCSEVGKEYSLSSQAVENLILDVCRFALGQLDEKYSFGRDSNGNDIIWPILMKGRTLQENCLEWTLRDEVVDAVRTILLDKLVGTYREKVLDKGMNFRGVDETYKWKFISDCQGKGPAEILDRLCKNDINTLAWRKKDNISKALSARREETAECFMLLEGDDMDSFDERFSKFSSESARIAKEVGVGTFGDMRSASNFLACLNPGKYTIYMYSLCSAFFSYIGYGKPVGYHDYLKSLELIIEKESGYPDLLERIGKDTDGLIHSEYLAAQDVLWQMQDFMKTAYRPRNWLQKMYREAIESGDGVFSNWYPFYESAVESFLSLFSKEESPDPSTNETVYNLIKETNNSIANVTGLGVYSEDQYQGILKKWPEIYSILKKCVSSDSIPMDDYLAVKHMIEDIGGRSHPTAFHRIWAGLFPEMLTTVVKQDMFVQVYDHLRLLDSDLPQRKGTWLEANLDLMDYFHRKVVFDKKWHSAVFAWYLHERIKNPETDPTMNTYINLLKNNHNLVLTGAPGTGKTFLAKEIAAKMLGTDMNSLESDPRFGFVQFHPSYDYTDFVEGLRPTKEGGFQRENGVFKEFCKLASEDTGHDYVFVIDEINRGEISKIFGELFFCIEHGYRGPKGRVKTQYQNMLDKDDPSKQDPFHGGFYVPQTVYIIGTMNDIDRGVESMDFAVRRRFCWVEVTAEERKDMLDEQLGDYAEDAISSMTAINRVISDPKNGLSRAYEIGPAYYLKLSEYNGSFENLWKYSIKGLLYEYLRGTRNPDETIEKVFKPAFFSFSDKK